MQNSDFYWLFGVQPGQSQTVGSVVASRGAAFNMTYGYGYQIMRKSAASLWAELASTFGNGSIHSSALPGAGIAHWTVYAPGLRFMVPVHPRLSVYVAAGGGAGNFWETYITTGATPSLASRMTWHGVFDTGGGVDIRLKRAFSLRGEFRDYITGRGLSGSGGRHHPAAVIGFVLHH